MILYPHLVLTAENMQETVPDQESDFPYAAMEADLNLYADRCVPWHWHDHFEFDVMHRGEAILHLERESYLLREGDAYFVNSNVLHQLRAADGSPASTLRAQLFGRSILAGSGLVGRKYIVPIADCPSLDALIFHPEDPDHAELIAGLAAAFAAAETDADSHELEICSRLNLVWQKLYHIAKPRLRSGGPPSENTRRVKEMLTFIHDNYARPIQVSHIAAAAGVCERECFRCFALALGTTPMDYLARHRIAVASRLLRETTRTVADVAAACGFSDPGYFGKVFRKILGVTPGAYRRNG